MRNPLEMTKSLYFCTYFDINYISRALAMYNSLVQHCGNFQIYMLCFDNICVSYLQSLRLDHATVISLEAFEAGDDELVATKNGRTKLEYYYTCGPSLPLYILKNYPEIDLITYLDADLYFYSNPKALINEMDGYSISITVHNFPEYRPAPSTGKYNVGWLSFRRDTNGLACLQWWREKCIEWCYERFEAGKYADQLYLDEWPKLFSGVKIIQNKGANVAAWNVSDYKFYEECGRVMVSGYPLIFYHFHGFKQITHHIYNTNLGLTLRFPSKILKDKIFHPYIVELNKNIINYNATPSIRVKKLRPRWIQIIRTAIRIMIGIIFRQYVVVIDDKVY